MKATLLETVCALCFLLGGLTAGLPHARAADPDAPAPPKPDAGGGSEAVSPRILAFVKPIDLAAGDDELTRKLKERHNVAANLLEIRAEEYKRGVRDLSPVLEAARLVVEAKLDLAGDDQARLAVLEQSLEVARLIEARLKTMHEAGLGARSDYCRAQLARLNVEVEILKAKRAAAPKQP
jgi:hypothetical protein